MKRSMFSVKYKFMIAVIAVLMSSIFFIFGRVSSGKSSSENNTQEEYPYLANRLFGAQKNDMIINFTQLREVMKNRYSEKNIQLGVYFEYLPTGASIGVNDQLEVKIGSLTKVPAVMAVYKQIENGTLSSSDTLVVKESNIDKNFGDLWRKGIGTQLSLKEATELTLKKSDNTAASTLVSTLPDGALAEIFDQLDLPKTRTGPFPTMSPKSYASVFRSLYLATFLSYENSNLILETLADSDFKDKLPAGVSLEVDIAHKIGVFQIGDEENIYGDCGIVYVPLRPYTLCILVNADESTARDEIMNYSKMVYSFVSQVKPSKKAAEL